jgi:glycosyltransferase involved in cell wall biosynthesis
MRATRFAVRPEMKKSISQALSINEVGCKGTVLVAAGEPKTVVRFRFDLLKTMVAVGYRVYVTTPEMSPEDVLSLNKIGVTVIETPMSRANITPVSDLRYTKQMIEICRSIKPDIVLAYTIKAVVFGTLAARLAGVRRVSALVPGLGYAFSEIETAKRRMIGAIARNLYRFAFSRCDVVIFQNCDDIDTVVEKRLISREKCRLVDGSGVNIDTFPAIPLPVRFSFLMAARLLKSKGIYEYIEAAQLLQARFPDVDFCIAGPEDPSPDSIDPSVLAAASEQGTIKFLGNVNDIRKILASSTVFVLPSYYREGIPRAGLEALATGRPVIACDSPGCRETVVHEVNGYLIAPRDVDGLAAAMASLIQNPDLVEKMALASRSLAEARFDNRKVNQKMLEHLDLVSRNDDGTGSATPLYSKAE